MDVFTLLAETTLPAYVDEIVLILIKLFGAALIALAALAIRKLGNKWGFEHTAFAEERGRVLAQDALSFAERWARNRDARVNAETGNAFDKDKKTSGADKLEAALDFAIEADEAIGASDKARAAFAKRIESELERTEGKNGYS